MPEDKSSVWGCPCGAVWPSLTQEPPEDRMCSPTCPKPPLFRITDRESPDLEETAYDLATEFCLRAPLVRPCRPCVDRALVLMTSCDGS